MEHINRAGDISGPTSATDTEVATFDGTTGKKIQAGSGVTNPSAGRLDLIELRITDGKMSLHGTARVTKNIWLDAAGLKAPGSKPAIFVKHGLTGVWQFSDAGAGNEEAVSGTYSTPTDMDRTVEMTLGIGWSTATANAGNCKWQLEYLWRSLNEATNAAAQETLTAIGAASATGKGASYTVFSGIDLPSTTDSGFYYEITRLSADAQDTIVDTVEMRGRMISYTSNKLGA